MKLNGVGLFLTTNNMVIPHSRNLCRTTNSDDFGIILVPKHSYFWAVQVPAWSLNFRLMEALEQGQMITMSGAELNRNT